MEQVAQRFADAALVATLIIAGLATAVRLATAVTLSWRVAHMHAVTAMAAKTSWRHIELRCHVWGH